MTVDQVRQSRAQRQAQTREKLIEVAREMFLDVGYAASSLDKVAIAAGFSKGAVYSNFSGKEELCMAVSTRSTRNSSKASSTRSPPTSTSKAASTPSWTGPARVSASHA